MLITVLFCAFFSDTSLRKRAVDATMKCIYNEDKTKECTSRVRAITPVLSKNISDKEAFCGIARERGEKILAIKTAPGVTISLEGCGG